jgi:CelD/BcsL family acetyltransferase involved in cellulose biosynthesis
VSPVTVEEIRGDEAFDRLRVEWQALYRSAAGPSPFLSWEWIAAWHRWLGGGRTPRLFCARSGGDLVGLLPLGEERRWGVTPGQVRSLSFLGERLVGGDYLDVLALPGWEPAATSAIFDHLARDDSFDVLDVDGLAGDSRSLPLLAWRFGVDPRFEFDLQPGQICPYLTLDGGWEDTLRRTRRPHQFKRLQRELRSLPGFETRTATAPEEVGPALERLLELHARRWSAQGGSDAMARPAVKAFHRDAGLRLARAGIARIEELWIDGACRASYYGMQSGDRYYLYQTGFDVEWARRSVAFIRLGLSIQEAANRGVKTYDFLRGNETYKFDWANATRITVRVQVARRGPAPALFLARRELRTAAKLALKASLPGSGLEWLRRRRRSWEQRQGGRTPTVPADSARAPQPLSSAAQPHL